MSGGIIRSVIAPHTPRMGYEPSAPEFVRGLMQGLRELGSEIRTARPDAIVLCSTHWVTTFNWYLTGCARHRGRCLADEAPDMFPPIPYDRPGDPLLAAAIAAAITAAGVPGVAHDIDEASWDYGSCVPLLFIDPDQTIPVVLMGTCLLATLDECLTVGRAVREAAVTSGRKVVFIASSALSHALVRGPDRWPSEARQAMDRKLVELLREGRVGEAKEWFPSFAREGEVEMGGRVVAVMLGTLDEHAARYSGVQIGAYAQSSGSGNTSLIVTPAP